MNEQEKPLLVINVDRFLTMEEKDNLYQAISKVATQVGMCPLLIDGGMTAEVHRDMQPLVDSISQLAQSNRELVAVIADMLAEQVDDGEEEEPKTYMDGTPR